MRPSNYETKNIEISNKKRCGEILTNSFYIIVFLLFLVIIALIVKFNQKDYLHFIKYLQNPASCNLNSRHFDSSDFNINFFETMLLSNIILNKHDQIHSDHFEHLDKTFFLSFFKDFARTLDLISFNINSIIFFDFIEIISNKCDNLITTKAEILRKGIPIQQFLNRKANEILNGCTTEVLEEGLLHFFDHLKNLTCYCDKFNPYWMVVTKPPMFVYCKSFCYSMIEISITKYLESITISISNLILEILIGFFISRISFVERRFKKAFKMLFITFVLVFNTLVRINYIKLILHIHSSYIVLN